MKKILITQRLDNNNLHKELRDSLDINLSLMIFKFGFLPILIPNKVNFLKFISIIKPDGFLLSGGGDPRKINARSNLEAKIIKYCIEKKIPLLGICRGAQQINLFLKGKIYKIQNHVKKNHIITGKIIKKKTIVNSYHKYGIKKGSLGNGLEPLAYSDDGYIECFKGKKNYLFGIMWHPERFNKTQYINKKIISMCFNKTKYK